MFAENSSSTPESKKPARVVVVDNVAASRDKWLDARKGRIGASEIATIAGLNPYKTPLFLWHEMTGRIDHKEEESDAMWVGTKLEGFVAEFYTRKTQIPVVPFNQMIALSDAQWASATPDFISATTRSLLECKVTSEFNKKLWSDGVPDQYHLQAIWQMGVTGIESCIVAALVGGNKLMHKEVPYDELIFEQLFSMAETFLIKNVRADTPPPAVDDDKDDLLLDPVKGKITTIDCIELLEHYGPLYKNYKAQQKMAGELESQVKDCKAQIRQAMGDAALATCGSWKIGAAQVNVKESLHKPYSYVRLTVKDQSEKEASDD